MHLSLLLSLGPQGSLVLGESAAHFAGEPRAEVEGKVFLVLVEKTQLRALVGVDDRQDTGDRLANVVAVFPLVSNSTPYSIVFRLFPTTRSDPGIFRFASVVLSEIPPVA